MPLSPVGNGAGSARKVLRKSGAVAVIAAGLALLAFVAQPSAALAISRPSWNPGPPWAPLAPWSSEMRSISDLFWVMLVLSAIIFAFVTFMVLYSAFKFSGKPGDPEPPQVYGNRTVEMIWTAIPFVILIVAFGFTVAKIHSINTPAKGATLLDVNVIGHQWWWEFRYPKYTVVTADEVHVPTGTTIHFHIGSADVVHSYWVPQLQRQIDANPGQDNAVFVDLDKPGTFDGMCYEYCGDGHAWMKFRLIVQTPSQFMAWVHHEQASSVTPPAGSAAAAGQRVFLSNTCISCHAITGTPAGGVVGPNLTHLATRWTIGAGAAPLSRADLIRWIRNPGTYKPGVLMPPYPLLSQKDLNDLADYLMSLK